VENSCSDLSAGQVLAIVEAVVLAALVVIHSNHMSLHCVVEVLSLDENI